MFEIVLIDSSNRDLKFNVKGSRTGIVSPIEVTFSEIGTIPPPRMFSDTNTITLTIRSEVNDQPKNIMEVDCDDEAKAQSKTTSVTNNSLLPVGEQESPRNSPCVTVIRDEDLVKEPPELTSMPKKSALKKSKTTASSAIHTSANIPPEETDSTSERLQQQQILQPPLPSERYVFSFTPRPPASQILTSSTGTRSSLGSDSDSDCDEPIKWRDYYGDDERRKFSLSS